MTDSQTSEMLRKLLTERGIEYRTTEVHGMPVTLYESGGRTWSVTDHPNGYLVVNCVSHTPEQAIAATLGNDAKPCYATDYTHGRCKYSVNRGWTEDTKFYIPTMRHGTLTAEQVREAVMSADRWEKPMGNTGLTNTHLIIRDDGWQAIADEFNAELGSEHHAYEQRITGDGSDWGEIMRNAYDNLMATACESCTPEQMEQLADYIRAELGSGTCEWATDSEGVRIDVADTVHMLRSEYDGDHEWDDVVIELAYCKHGGDRWIVRGARGEAWACDCTVTGHDEELYDKSDDWENLPTPWDAPDPDGWHTCPECGCTVGYTELYGGGWSIMMDDYQIPYNNCPKCGRPILMCDVEAER